MRINERNEALEKYVCLRNPTTIIGAVSINPAHIIVAPVSPKDLVNANIAPAIKPSLISGNEIVLKTVNFGAESVIAAFSKRGFTFSIAIFRFLTI